MKAVIFDLDGTLVDSAPAVCAVANAFMGEIGLKPLNLAEARGYIGHGAANFLQQALKAREAFDPDLFPMRLSRFQTLYDVAPGSDNIPFPGVDGVLRELTANWFKIGLCTNKPEGPTLNVLNAMGWREFFTAIVTGDTLPQKKPDPAPLIEAMKQLEVDRAIYVGDSEIDAATAKAARLPFILHTEGYRKSAATDLPCAASFSNFAALPALLVSTQA